MRRIPGNVLALVGLVLGLSVGLGVVLLKKYLVQEIVQALEEELVIACPNCKLNYETFTINFLSLSGQATNITMEEEGVPRISFPEISATFSIQEILAQKVYLETLVLSDGQVDGVGPDSVMFRFIDQLTKPLPPEQQNKPRWRAILNTLEIKNASIRESFGGSELTGADVGLFVKRIGEHFVLLPSIEDLRYRSFLNPEKTEVKELPLGRVSGSVVIEEGRTLFNSLRLGRDDSVFEMKASADSLNNDALSGSAAYQLNTQYIGLPDWLIGLVAGTGTVQGSLGSPIITGSLENASQTPITLAFPNASPVTLSSLHGEMTVDVNHGDPVVTLKNIAGSGDKSSLISTKPLVFSDEGLRAGFEIALPQFSYGPFSIANGKARLSIKPSGNDTITEIQVDAGDLIVQGTSLGPSKLSLTIKPDTVDVVADSNDPRLGSFHWDGSILLNRPEPFLKNGKLVLTNYQYPLSMPVDPARLSPVQVSTTMPLSGPLDLGRLSGEGLTTIAFPSLRGGIPLSGKTSLKDGILNVALPTSAYRGSVNLKLDLTKTFEGKLSVQLPRVPLSQFLENADCGLIDAALDYSFTLSSPLGGSGNLSLHDFHVGCAPYVMQVPRNSVLPITDGALRFKNMTLSGGNTALELNGSFGIGPGADISLTGGLHLSSLLPLLPSVDNLQGLLSTKMSLKGPLSNLTYSGTAELSNGEIAVESPDIGAHDVNGRFVLEGNAIRVDNLKGSLNNGTFSINGTLLPFNLPDSKLTANLKEVTVEPIQDASITFSGDLALGMSQQKHQTLSGNITIDFAEISKDFDLNRILMQTIKGYFLPTRIQPQVSSKPVAVDLDVSFKAPRNIFVITPFFSAELNTNIHAGGTTTDPALTGSMQLLSGWVGLKGNRFDVTAGSLTFKPGSLTPHLEIASEGVLRAPSGESILVLLEASGPLTAPRITLSSDRGLSQEELLLLITSSRSLTGRTLANQVGTQFGDDKRFFLSPDSFSSFEAFFSNLTKIDTLSFEPTYNQYTGLVEPAIVARKNLTPRFALVGNSLFSSVSNSKAGVVYNLTPSLDINGFIQSVSTQQNPIASSDLTYTILSEQPSLVDITVTGLAALDEQDILIAARLGRDSRILPDKEGLSMIRRDIVASLNDQGFLAADATLSCAKAARYCQELLINVSEGPRFTISSVVLEGSTLPAQIDHLASHITSIGSYATGKLLAETERQLVLALRNEGYISARVIPSYRRTQSPDSVALVIASDIREPISFVFKGNTVFTSEQFLDSIDLFKRKRPFGNNTIKLLMDNIEHMYQAAGYLFAQVTFTEDRSNLERLVYVISIAEETQTQVKSLTIRGNDSVPLRKIKDDMRTMGFADQLPLLHPNFAVPTQLDTLKGILLTVFQQEGYPEVSVDYTISPVKDEDALEIVFTVTEGPAVQASHITLSKFPDGIKAPEPPTMPASLPSVNQYVEQLLDTLQSEGYLFPSITAEPALDSSGILLTISTGPRSHIGSVTFEGISEIEEPVARKYCALKSGNPYRLEDVNATKRELLRSGLFSRVEVVATDGKLASPQEDITVRIVERPLQTLEVGTGANSEFGVHVFGEAVDKSLFSDGRSLSTRIDTYFDQAQVNPTGSSAISQGFANLRYLDPFFMDSDYSLTEEVRFQRQELTTQEFNLDRLTFASYLFRQFDAGVTVTGGHSLTFDNLQDVTPGAIITPLDEGHVRLSFLSGTIKLDRRNDPLSPQQGYTFTLEPRLSAQEIGSEANFGAILARSTGIVPLDMLSPRLSLGLGLSGGIGQPWGDTVEIPITQRFYLGGRTTVRGFKENSLGPKGSDGAVIGGDTLVNEKNQLQYLLTDSISSHVFMDIGTVYLRHQSMRLSDLRYSTGVGFQYLSPIGPIGFDVGHPLDRQEGEDNFRFHFSVGSAF